MPSYLLVYGHGPAFQDEADGRNGMVPGYMTALYERNDDKCRPENKATAEQSEATPYHIAQPKGTSIDTSTSYGGGAGQGSAGDGAY